MKGSILIVEHSFRYRSSFVSVRIWFKTRSKYVNWWCENWLSLTGISGHIIKPFTTPSQILTSTTLHDPSPFGESTDHLERRRVTLYWQTIRNRGNRSLKQCHFFVEIKHTHTLFIVRFISVDEDDQVCSSSVFIEILVSLGSNSSRFIPYTEWSEKKVRVLSITFN